jgi:hypothetical protein
VGLYERVIPQPGRSAALSISEIVVSIVGWVVTIVVLAVAGYMGWLRPTGLAGRTRAEKEKDRQRDVAAKWLKKDGEQTGGPH